MCIFLWDFLIFCAFSSYFLLWKIFLIFCFVTIYCVGARITTLMSICDVLDPYFFQLKDGKDSVYERRNGRKGVYFPPESEIFFSR